MVIMSGVNSVAITHAEYHYLWENDPPRPVRLLCNRPVQCEKAF